MKTFLLLLSALLTLSSGLASCSTDEPELPPQTEQPSAPDQPGTPGEPDDDNEPDNPMSNQLKINIGNASFNVTLEDNAATKAFKTQLPMTVSMSELNDNEKYFNLSIGLPTASTNPGTIRTGDLMLYGSTTVVLFYESFSTSYSYTRLGRMDNSSGLAAALGSGSIEVKFEIQ